MKPAITTDAGELRCRRKLGVKPISQVGPTPAACLDPESRDGPCPRPHEPPKPQIFFASPESLHQTNHRVICCRMNARNAAHVTLRAGVLPIKTMSRDNILQQWKYLTGRIFFSHILLPTQQPFPAAQDLSGFLTSEISLWGGLRFSVRLVLGSLKGLCHVGRVTGGRLSGLSRVTISAARIEPSWAIIVRVSAVYRTFTERRLQATRHF